MIASVEDIELAVQNLSLEELKRFRDWFIEFDAKAWDSKIKSDVAAGRLDKIADAAIEDYKAGKSRAL